jgi:hypothetical protein
MLVQPVNSGRNGIRGGVIASLQPCCWMRLVGQDAVAGELAGARWREAGGVKWQ